MIYLDNASTTKPGKRVLDRVFAYMQENYGNSESIHQVGRKANEELEKARDCIACYFNCSPYQIIFTSGASESNALALSLKRHPLHVSHWQRIIYSEIEHKSIINNIENNMYSRMSNHCKVDKKGIIDLYDLKSQLCNSYFSTLVVAQYANNEIGTIQPIKTIASICEDNCLPNKQNMLLVDATQAVSSIPIDLGNLKVDYMSFSGHKIHGIQGSGVLFVRNPNSLKPIIHGGGQEFGLRGGTVNVAGAIATAEALKILKSEMDDDNKRIKELRDCFISEVERRIPCAELNGSRENRVVGNANFCFHGIDGESLLLALDMKGICASSGSACNAKDIQPSHVLLAIGRTKEEANSSVRFSIGKYNTMEEIKYTIDSLVEIVERLKS